MHNLEEFLSQILKWAAEQPDISAIALMGSYARGAAIESSDIDLVILTSSPGDYVQNHKWTALFGEIVRKQVEDWGKVTSLRVWYQDGKEVEFGLTSPDWGLPPIDPGTQRVIDDGLKILYDRDGIFAPLIIK